MKLCAFSLEQSARTPADSGERYRLMSDFEVTLVNDNMQEFYVRFNGPEESAPSLDRVLSGSG